MFDQIAKGQFLFHPDAWGGISAGAKDLVSHMLVVNPATRYTMKQVLSHPWVSARTASDGTSHLPTTITNLKKFNARRKIKAMVLAATFAGSTTRWRSKEGGGTSTTLASLLGGRTPFSDKELETMSAAFKSVAGTGVDAGVTLVQFSDVLAALGPSAAVGPLPADRIFAVFDTDGSGTVNWKELVVGLARLRSPSPEDAMRFAFQLYDVDNSGFLSSSELMHVLSATGFHASPVTSPRTSTGAEGAAAAATTIGAAAALEDATATSSTLEREDLAERIATIFELIDANRDDKSEL